MTLTEYYFRESNYVSSTCLKPERKINLDMKKYFALCLLLALASNVLGQNTLYIGDYAFGSSNYQSNVSITPQTQGASEYTLTFTSTSSDAYISTDLLEGGGNLLTPTSNLVINGQGMTMNIEILGEINHTGSSNRRVTIQNAATVHFNGGYFTRSSTGLIELRIGDDNMSSGSGRVTNLNITTNAPIADDAGYYAIAVNNITDNVGVTFEAINESVYSMVKFDTWTSTNTTLPSFETYVKNDGDRMICSPTTNGFTNASATNAAGTSSVTVTTSNLYRYDASDGDWETSNLSLTSPGIGYFGWVGSGTNTTGTFLANDESIFSVDGVPNNQFSYSLGYASNQATGGSGDGWNLIANPFPAPLDWAGMSSLLSNVNDAIYIWDPLDENYDYYVDGISAPTGSLAGSVISNGKIAPMQSFWIQVSSNSGGSISQITSSSNTTVKANPTALKTIPDNLILVLQNTGDSSMYDVSWIKNMTNTSIEFEGDEDAWKYKNPNKPSIYTTDSLDEGMAINSVDLANHHYIPFTIETYLGGTYTLNLEKVVVNPNAYQVYLLDTELNTTHDFSSGAATLSLDSAAIYDDRFALFATTSSTVGLDELNPTLDWKAISTKDGILVSLDQSDVQYELIDINGRSLNKGVFDYNTVIPVESTGTKILSVWCAEGNAMKKFNVIK